MKSSWRIALGLVVIGIVVVPATMRGITSDVFRVSTTLQGVIQSGPASNSIIEKVKIQSEDLVNLAQGRTLGTPVPKNGIGLRERLSRDFAADHLRHGYLEQLGAIGQAIDLSTAFPAEKYEETIVSLDPATPPQRAGFSSIVGGGFYYHGKININTSHPPVSADNIGVAGFPFIATNVFCTNYIDSVTLTKCMTNCITTNGSSAPPQPPDCITNATPTAWSAARPTPIHADCTPISSPAWMISVIVRAPLTVRKSGTSFTRNCRPYNSLWALAPQTRHAGVFRNRRTRLSCLEPWRW
jgi:hypothetical protein